MPDNKPVQTSSEKIAKRLFDDQDSSGVNEELPIQAESESGAQVAGVTETERAILLAIMNRNYNIEELRDNYLSIFQSVNRINKLNNKNKYRLGIITMHKDYGTVLEIVMTDKDKVFSRDINSSIMTVYRKINEDDYILSSQKGTKVLKLKKQDIDEENEFTDKFADVLGLSI